MLLKTLQNWLESIQIYVNVLILSLCQGLRIVMHRKSILGLSFHTRLQMIRLNYFSAPFPPSINDILKKRIRHLHLATNPVRIQYCTQEIVIFREDLLQKLCRYCIKLPSDNLPMHVSITILINLYQAFLFSFVIHLSLKHIYHHYQSI